MWAFWTLLAMTACLVALPGVVYASRRHERAAIAVLARASCPACGHPFNSASAARAFDEHSARRQAAFRDAAARGYKLRLSQNWWFPCPACGVELDYLPAGELRVSQRTRPR
jgi:hypothetical protein